MRGERESDWISIVEKKVSVEINFDHENG